MKRKGEKAGTYEGIYETIDEAVGADKALCEAMETIVKIIKCKEGYELFGNGEIVMTITE